MPILDEENPVASHIFYNIFSDFLLPVTNKKFPLLSKINGNQSTSQILGRGIVHNVYDGDLW